MEKYGKLSLNTQKIIVKHPRYLFHFICDSLLQNQ